MPPTHARTYTRTDTATQRHRDTETQRHRDTQTHRYADTRRHKTPRHILTCTRARHTHNAHMHVAHTSVQMRNVYVCNRGCVQRKMVMMHVLVHTAREGSCRGEGVTQQETPGHFNTHKHKHTHKHRSSTRTLSHRCWWARQSRWWGRWRRWRRQLLWRHWYWGRGGHADGGACLECAGSWQQRESEVRAAPCRRCWRHGL